MVLYQDPCLAPEMARPSCFAERRLSPLVSGAGQAGAAHPFARAPHSHTHRHVPLGGAIEGAGSYPERPRRGVWWQVSEAAPGQ